MDGDRDCLAFLGPLERESVPGHLNARPRKGHLVSPASAAPGFSMPNYTFEPSDGRGVWVRGGTFSPTPVPTMVELPDTHSEIPYKQRLLETREIFFSRSARREDSHHSHQDSHQEYKSN